MTKSRKKSCGVFVGIGRFSVHTSGNKENYCWRAIKEPNDKTKKIIRVDKPFGIPNPDYQYSHPEDEFYDEGVLIV